MNISGNNYIKNNIFDGSYQGYLSPEGLSFSQTAILDPSIVFQFNKADLNPSGVTGIFVYFNTGTSIESGYMPKDYPKGISSGADSVSTNLSGYLYYRISEPLIGVCHGFGRDPNVWYNGYNFYNAFHPEGSFAPPFGQQSTIVQRGAFGGDALAENGNCSSLTKAEYNDMFGIVSQKDNAIEASIETPPADGDSFINSPAIACPQDLSVTFYWHEQQYRIIAGTVGSIGGTAFYNNNPIPTTLDNYLLKITDRYDSSGENTDSFTDNGDGTHTRMVKRHILYDDSGKPIPKYTSGSTRTDSNMSCQGNLAEGHMVVGTQAESQLLDAPDILNVPSKGTFDFFNWWNIWHFLFKENSDGFPFDNGMDNYGDNVGVMKTPWASHSSELFEYELSDSDKYWERRQCAEAISSLPHTFGASIYACPSYYFDVPYYAAIKKFGFYGTRFFNGCISLELDYPLKEDYEHHPNAVEIPFNQVYTTPGEGEPSNDKGINLGFSSYNNLLRLAAVEEKTSDFYAMNKTLFLWGNSGLIQQSSGYSQLTGNAKFNVIFKNLFTQFDASFPNGKTDLISGQSLFESGNKSIFLATGRLFEILGSNKEYVYFKEELNKVLTEPIDRVNWNNIETGFGNAFLLAENVIDTGFYGQLSDAKEERLKTRYIENLVRGNVVDLYPTNKIHFGYDKAGNFINSKEWGKSSFGPSNNHFSDTGLGRSFFLGAYGNGEDVLGPSAYLNHFSALRDSAFYPGYFDGNIGTELPVPSYVPAITGSIMSGDNISKLTDGWLAAGYNGIGILKSNFSCFTPIFTQQPMPKVYCKIGQSPTFRVSAVDYHTIPEDKMNIRWPEIVYWMLKLKVCDSKYNNRYPLSYKWYRVLKTDCSGDFKNFMLTPNFSKVVPSNTTGDWCSIEGDGPVCSLIHPKLCEPVFTPNTAWNSRYQNSPMYETAKQNNFYMTFKKGAVKGLDDQYFYFCMARGRFGIRISEPSELFIENWLKFDLSVQNGGNVAATPIVKFIAGSSEPISCSPINIPRYCGFAKDQDSVPEDVLEMQLPPPNAGFGDVYSYKFVGMWGYRGAAQSYTPGTLKETRGLRETFGRFLHYGGLIQYQVSLGQREGDILYGRNHLPICNNDHVMPTKQEGIKVVIDGVVHWANMQTAIADTDGRYGVKWNKLANAGMLYVPSVDVANAGQTTVSPGIGQWQWGNNLGTIHSFGWNSTKTDLAQSPYPLSDSDFLKLKNNLLNGGVLAGDNCGWHKNGLGRNVLYWIEGFSSFYIYCDSIKKKNIYNYNYMNPGLRQTNSSMQYFWLGKPSNAYLERYPLFGPYAYHWKVRKHNRDRNGNGVSEGFYSYGWNKNYSSQYDAPAIYGLFLKYGTSSKDLATLNAARAAVFGGGTRTVKNTRFGFTNGNGGARIYGNIWLGNINDLDTSQPQKNYALSGYNIARAPEFGLYGCSDADLKAGACFDPCLSMRYQLGFIAGGKSQDLTKIYPDSHGYRIVANSPVVGSAPKKETLQDASGIYFRGAFGTPHLTYLTSGQTSLFKHELNGFSPCFDGGADHCNYITPTLNFGSSAYQESQTSSFMANIYNASNSITVGGMSYNIS